MADIQNGNELLKVDVFKKIGLGSDMIVGDLGCGNLAFYAFNSAKIVGKNGMVFAIDVLKNVLSAVDDKIKNEGVENIKTVWSDLEMPGATKIPAGSLNVAFIHNVLFQSTKHDGFIKETNRLLKIGGRLMIIDWKKTGAPFGPPIKDRPDPQVIKGIVEKNGFKLLEEFEAGPHHFGLMFEKIN